VYDIDDIEMDDTTMSLLSALERVAELESEVKSLHETLANTEDQVDVLQGVCGDYEVLQANLKQEMAAMNEENIRLERELRATRGASSLFIYISLLISTSSSVSATRPFTYVDPIAVSRYHPFDAVSHHICDPLPHGSCDTVPPLFASASLR
jgi:phage shock protein A